MPFDNFTLTTVRALKECPQGQQPGDVFDVTADVAHILVTVGAAEYVTEPEPVPVKGTYKRRDLRAEK
jgi:hypothetical protein